MVLVVLPQKVFYHHFQNVSCYIFIVKFETFLEMEKHVSCWIDAESLVIPGISPLKKKYQVDLEERGMSCSEGVFSSLSNLKNNR